MSWTVELSRRAAKDLRGFPAPEQRRIIAKFRAVAKDPHRYFKRLTNHEAYRMRIGQIRVIADILDDERLVLIHRIGDRSTIYQ